MRLEYRRRNLVMLGYRAMHSEYYRLLFGRKVGSADRPFYALNAHMGAVNYLRHNVRMVSRIANNVIS